MGNINYKYITEYEEFQINCLKNNRYLDIYSNYIKNIELYERTYFAKTAIIHRIFWGIFRCNEADIHGDFVQWIESITKMKFDEVREYMEKAKEQYNEIKEQNEIKIVKDTIKESRENRERAIYNALQINNLILNSFKDIYKDYRKSKYFDMPVDSMDIVKNIYYSSAYPQNNIYKLKFDKWIETMADMKYEEVENELEKAKLEHEREKNDFIDDMVRFGNCFGEIEEREKEIRDNINKVETGCLPPTRETKDSNTISLERFKNLLKEDIDKELKRLEIKDNDNINVNEFVRGQMLELYKVKDFIEIAFNYSQVGKEGQI